MTKNKYEKPDLERPMEDLKKEVESDFNEMACRFNLPEELRFDAVVSAVRIGMIPRINYPFRKLQNVFTDYITESNSFNLSEDDINEMLQIFVAVWNHFPQDDIGMSPIEKLREEREKNPETFCEPSVESIMKNMSSEEYFQDLDEKILSLSDIAKAIFEVHLKSIGGTKKDFKAIIAILEDPEKYPGDALAYILKNVSKSAKYKKQKVYMEEVQPVVRALSACENYVASKMPNGHYNSRMFQDIARQSFENITSALESGGEMIEPIVPFDILGQSHVFIENKGNELKSCVELQEAAHHILDWLALTDISEIMTHEPREMALLSLGVAHLISKTVDPELALGCSAKRIKSMFEKITNKDSYEKEVSRLAEKALCNCNDPFLMIANLIDTPENWENSLSKIAPCLKLRSPVKPSDLPVPSPF